MTIFTIDTDNNITAYAELPSGLGDVQVFSSEQQLAQLSAEWPTARLVDIWNSFAGVAPFSDVKPVRKFTDRKSAVRRIWQALPRLTPVRASQPPQVQAKAPVVTKDTDGANSSSERQRESKSAQVLALLRRPAGATLSEIMQATGWQAHTVRGFISGTVTKKLGLAVVSSRAEDKQRIYRIRS